MSAPDSPWIIPYLAYCLFQFLASPILAVRGVLRARRRDYVRSLWRRLAGGSKPARAGRWVVLLAPHIGETKVAIRVSTLLRELGESDTAVLTTTDTARELGARHAVCGIAPFNNPLSCVMFLLRWKLKILVAVGSCDIAHLTAWCRLLRVPLVVVNTALTEPQADGIARNVMRRWRWQLPNLYAAPTHAVAERLLTLGVRKGAILATGPIGTWPEPRFPTEEGRSLWRSRLGLTDADVPIVIAGSTHREDEEVVAAAFQALQRRAPSAALVLAPRHASRACEVADRLTREGIHCTLRSRANPQLPSGRIIVLDTYGELDDLYQLADSAHVGGSLRPSLGAHTPVEALSWGVPVTLGPEYGQQHAIIEPLLASGVACVAKDPDALADAWWAYASDRTVRQRTRACYDRLRASERQAFARLWQRILRDILNERDAVLDRAAVAADASTAQPIEDRQEVRPR